MDEILRKVNEELNLKHRNRIQTHDENKIADTKHLSVNFPVDISSIEKVSA